MDLTLTLQCADAPGIVHAMTSAILEIDGNIIENQQFTDIKTNLFVMRTRFETHKTIDEARSVINSALAHLDPLLHIRPTLAKVRTLVLVTKESHCLRDLMYLQELGELPIEIPAVMSNHEDLLELVESHGIRFIYLGSDKNESEAKILEYVEAQSIDLVVLARYMQILSQNFCSALAGRIINIHHSFLPGFKGAKPYHQAFDRGVKIIGASAHFVTPDLDEGPIIEQDVAHVNHTAQPEDLISIGRDIERRTLSKAVKLYAQDRIFIVGDRTVIF